MNHAERASLAAAVQQLAADPDLALHRAEARSVFAALRQALNAGQVRAAEPDGAGGWQTHAWVKQGILLGFRLGELVAFEPAGPLHFTDKDTLPLRTLTPSDGVRLVPGGSSVRDGAFLAPGVVCMPPCYVNIGAYVDSGSMIDSHALVGSCAQIGCRVHISAAAQIGGVLEPVHAAPVIIEDDALIGGNCGIYEGARIGAGAVLGAGVVLTRSTPLYDLPRGEVYHAAPGEGLRVPSRAVVVPGARAVTRGQGPVWGLSLYAPVIVKYRDDATDAATALEAWLR
ncbi:MAG: 2,3,4,5-tetrahydropyridine-2,6-dicarboxylate N-succinyltransferase [Terriglobales bacterium]